MILKIKSNNEYLLNILYKKSDINNGVTLLSNKNGYIIGHVISENQYDILFQDTKYSYNENMSNMLDQQSLSNSKIVLDINNGLFNNLLKPIGEVLDTINLHANKTYRDIDTKECTIEISNVFIDSTWVKDNKFLLCKYFPQHIIGFEKISGDQYKFNIKADSVVEAINILSFVFLMITVTNEQPYFLADALVKKYIRILSNIKNLPYFVVYLFKVRVLFSPTLFNSNKELLESLIPNLTLTMHNNHTHKVDYITELFKDDSNDILDFGCGELKYFKKLGSLLKGDTRNYFAVDLEDYTDYLNKLAEKYKFVASFYKNIRDIKLEKPTTVICSEVIEHMNLDNAKNELEYLLYNSLVDKIIITTPNKEFNEHYMMGRDMRHDDHQIEMTDMEFQKFIISLSNIDMFDITHCGLGDTIEGVQPTSLVILKRK